MNRILALPIKIQAEVDELIRLGNGAVYIRDFLSQRYGTIPNIVIPSLQTIVRYIRHYRSRSDKLYEAKAKKDLVENFDKEFTKITTTLKKVEQSPSNLDKTLVLEDLIQKCNARIARLESEQKKVLKANNEAIIVRYVTEIRNIIETLAKITGEVRENEKVVVQVVQGELFGLLDVIKQIVLEVCPERFDLFKEKLKVKLLSKFSREIIEGTASLPQTPEEEAGLVPIEPMETRTELVPDEYIITDDASGEVEVTKSTEVSSNMQPAEPMDCTELVPDEYVITDDASGEAVQSTETSLNPQPVEAPDEHQVTSQTNN
jgi:hypothetical protein